MTSVTSAIAIKNSKIAAAVSEVFGETRFDNQQPNHTPSKLVRNKANPAPRNTVQGD
jgi:hypothetical protein